MKIEDLKKFTAYPTIKVVDAMEKIEKNLKGILFIINDKGELIGTVTDGDIRRHIVKTGNLQAEISVVMNKKPRALYSTSVGNYHEFLVKNHIRIAPVLTPDNVVCDMVTIDDSVEIRKKHSMSLKDVPLVIMAGGKGTRLYPYTRVLPKPLIPIGDVPIMERIIDRFREYGIEELWVTLNYKRGMIKSYFAELDPPYQLNYVVEDKPLGTAGSLHLIKEKFDKPIIVTNCDVLIDADYEDLYRYHLESGNELTMVTALKNVVVPYGVVHSKENGIITSMEEKPKLSYFVNTGMYILNAELLSEIPEDTFYHMTDLTEHLLQNNRQVGMYPISGDCFLDMGEFEEMHRMEEKLGYK